MENKQLRLKHSMVGIIILLSSGVYSIVATNLADSATVVVNRVFEFAEGVSINSWWR